MRRLTFLTSAMTLLSSSVLLCMNAFAADAGTYRPGNTYNSITANSPDICQMQCSGDAQCRSWNYIRIGEMAEGVCEFNDTMASPVPSAASISGNNVSRERSPRLVAGQTNTVRVGAPSVTQAAVHTPRITPARTTSAMSQSPLTSPSTETAHLSLMQQQRLNSQRRTMQNTSAPPLSGPNRAASAPQQAHSFNNTAVAPRQQFRHSLEDAPIMPAPRTANAAPPQMTAPTMPMASTAYADPRLVKKLQQRQRPQSEQAMSGHSTVYPPANPSSPPQTLAAAGGLSAPPGVPPLSEGDTSAPALGTSSYMRPSMAGAPPPPHQRRVTIPDELSPRPMGSGDSLFGSLYDDVKVPRPVDPAIAADPNAPIPTVSSVPVGRIQSGPLSPPQ